MLPFYYFNVLLMSLYSLHPLNFRHFNISPGLLHAIEKPVGVEYLRLNNRVTSVAACKFAI